jgi:predicted Zn-dependent protease
MRRHLTALLAALLVVAVASAAGVAQGQDETPQAQEQAEPPAAQEPVGEIARGESAPEMTPEEKADAEIGRSAAEEVEERFEILEDCPELPRLTEVVRRLRPATEKPHQYYRIRVIDSKALNAFALPGGYLYFTRGLLDAVESEDELAAAAAHEMAHVCLMHSRQLMSKDARYQRILGSILLVSVLSSSDSLDAGKLAMVGGLVVQDALNHYGREAELEADRQALRYLLEGGRYNPVAVLTVVEGLARIEAGRPQTEMGVFQSHPHAKERVQAVVEHLTEMGVPIERRRVTHSLAADAGPVTANDREIGELRLNGRTVYRPAAELDGLSPVARAERSAEVLDSLLLANLRLLEITSVEEEAGARIEARGETILAITPEDAAFHESTAGELLERAMAVIRLSFSEEKVQRAY